MSDLGKLIKRMDIQHKYIFLLLLRAPFDTIRTWMLANLMKSIFLCLETDNAASLSGICVIYGLICALLFTYNGIIWSKYAAFSARTEVWLQKMLLDKILSLPLKRVNKHFSGEWITRLNSDIQAAFTMMNGPMNIPHLIVAVTNTVMSSFLIFKSSLPIFGITWILILPQLFINDRIVLKAIPKLKEKSQNAMAENTSAIQPLITDADIILLYDAGKLMMKNCNESSRKLMKVNMKIHVRNVLSDACMRLFAIGGYLIILLIGYRLIYYGKLAFSDVVYCFQTRGSVLAGISMLIACQNNLKANTVCIKRINDTLEEEPVI